MIDGVSSLSTSQEQDEATGEGDLSAALTAKLDPLRPFVERTASVTFDGQDFFVACLVSSFVKSFEFAALASRSSGDGAFFLTASLRSIVEDIILLNFFAGSCHEQREFALTRLMEIEVKQNTRNQNAFFRTSRPFQPVMPERINDEKQIKEELSEFWRRNGWQNFLTKGATVTPPTVEIAAKSKPRLLGVVYDFIYRLSSNSVHFRPGALLRMGWGADRTHMTFSPRNFGGYFLAMCQVYGCYLLCLYFELFDDVLKPNQVENKALVDLRRHLLWNARWPEMVTFEEMNFPVPSEATLVDTLSHASYVEIMVGGFIAGTEELQRLDREGLPLWPTHRPAD